MEEREFDVTMTVSITAKRRIKAKDLADAERKAEDLYMELPYNDYEYSTEPEIYVNERKEE